MPLIETTVLPKYPADKFEVTAIHSFYDGQPAAAHVQEFGLTFDVAFDFDSEVFRRLRLPAQVFPLNMVVDQTGKIAYLGTELAEALKVVDGLVK